MLSQGTKSKPLQLAFLLFLASIYLCQLLPHGHAAGHTEPAHEVPAPHASHSHSDHSNHEHDDHETDRPDESHHHHALAQHLDPHFRRTQDRELTPERYVSSAAVEIQLSPVLPVGEERSPEPQELQLDPQPLPTSGPRAPPLQG